MESLTANHTNVVITSTDVSNQRQISMIHYMTGRTTIEALLSDLFESEDWVYPHVVDSNRHAHYLFFATKQAMKMARYFPDVLLVDCTYKANKYGMPLLHSVGVMPTQRFFTAVLCFMPSETKPEYEWALKESEPSGIGPQIVYRVGFE
jgi:hypothetical protein